jgi:hypothetical protein
MASRDMKVTTGKNTTEISLTISSTGRQNMAAFFYVPADPPWSKNHPGKNKNCDEFA